LPPRNIAALITLGLILLPGCKVPVPKPPLVETIAVLLFESESTDVDAPEILQRLVYLALKPSSYRVVDIEETNKILNKAGVKEGGQLPVLDPVLMGKDLGVQALLYGNVESFGYLNVGFYVSRKVTLELKLVDAFTGETLWENEGTGATRKFAVNEEDIKENFAKGLADPSFGGPDEGSPGCMPSPSPSPTKWERGKRLFFI